MNENQAEAESAKIHEKCLKVFSYVLRTGCHWKAVPKSEYGGSSLIHKYFLEWQAMAVFEQLWRASLSEYDEIGDCLGVATS